MPSMESSTGNTKHAESCCSSLPAFIKVGEFGMNLRLSIIWRNLSLDDVRRYPQEHLDGLLYSLTVLVLFEVALRQNSTRVVCEFYICKPVTVYFHTHPPNSTAPCPLSITRFGPAIPRSPWVLYLPLPIPEPASRTSSVRNWSTSVYCL